MKATFKIHYDTVWGESLALSIGGCKYPMQWGDGAVWSVCVTDCKASDLLDYQYFVIKDGLIARCEWEAHSVKIDGRRKSVEIRDNWKDCPQGTPFVRKHSAEEFDRPGFRCAGTAVPVFALRSKEDFGIGDFRDLHALTDWAAASGQRIIQLLPVCDTTRRGGWEDSYPYNPISAFALNPLYMRLQDIGVEEDEEFVRLRDSLNALPQIDWPLVFASKMSYIRKAFLRRGAKDMESRAFRLFKLENEALWLGEYAEFCARRDAMEADYYRWMQWHLDKQFRREADYARSRGVYFKGDLPIGISADSAEAYWHPELFNLDSTAGAPPDFFSSDGQNWGFPTYNWEAMEKDDYDWWKKRLKVMSRYFDAFRIDHILGFFRIWEIPLGAKSGCEGHFNPALPYSREEIERSGLPIEGLFHEDPRKGGLQPLISPDTSRLTGEVKERFDALYNDFFYHRHNEYWRRNAEKKLPALLGATGMLACGEDLGMIPDCVLEVMEHERILSLEMPMMDKGRPWPLLSVCTTSSHDMETMRMQHFSRTGADLDCGSAYDMLKGILSSAPMLAIFPIQDWLAIDSVMRRKNCGEERINEPANPHHKWRYRMHIGVEELVGNTPFCAKLRDLIASSGR